MKLEDLKPGLYQIARDTKNPAPDRRVTSDWRAAEVWDAGAVVSVVFDELGLIEGDPTAAIIKAEPFRGLAGAKYPSSNALNLGTHTAKRGWRQASADASKGKDALKVVALLEVLEPFEPTTVDDALRAFNDADFSVPKVEFRELALQLLFESAEPFASVAARVRARLAQRSDKATEYDADDLAFATVALMRELPGDPSPEHTIRRDGNIECHGCKLKFVTTLTFGPPVGAFTAHLPCRGPKGVLP
jgi:hypothetical protein